MPDNEKRRSMSAVSVKRTGKAYQFMFSETPTVRGSL